MEEFKEKYNSTKRDYLAALSSAILETDPEKQSKLIEGVQSLNSQMAQQVRVFIEILSKQDKDVNHTTIDELKKELIKHQEEYDKIQKSDDRLTTLKMLKANQNDLFTGVSFMYNLYLAALVCLCFLIVYLIFVTNLSSEMTGGRLPKGTVFLV